MDWENYNMWKRNSLCVFGHFKSEYQYENNLQDDIETTEIIQTFNLSCKLSR